MPDFPILIRTDHPIRVEYLACPMAQAWKAESTPGEEAFPGKASFRYIANLRVCFFPNDRGQQNVRIEDLHAKSSLPGTSLEKMDGQGGVVHWVERRDNQDHIGVGERRRKAPHFGMRGHAPPVFPLTSCLHN